MNTKDTFSHIGDILGGVMKSIRPGGAPDISLICELWRDSVDRDVLENAQPLFLRGGTLYIRVASSGWIQHLHYIKNDIIASINSTYGKDIVDELRFKVGPVCPRK